MPESLETFVKKLQSEGVDVGKEAAKKIKNEAKREAEKILADAKTEAEKIAAKAKDDAEKLLSRARSDMELGVRDAVLKLREALGLALSAMLIQRSEKKLSEPDYMGEILREVIVAYAKADAGQQPRMEFNISEKMREKLNETALEDLFHNLNGEHDEMGLKATLSKAGFEYKIHGATVEVSPESLSELLSEMVNPALQEVIDKVMGKQDQKTPKEKPTQETAGKSRTGPDKLKEQRAPAKDVKR